MRKYGYLLAAALLLLAGCGRESVPADGKTAAAMTAEADASTTEITDGTIAGESVREPAETGSKELEKGREQSGERQVVPKIVDALVTYEYLSEWEDYNLILRGTSPKIWILDDGYEELQKSLDTYCAERLTGVQEVYESWLPDAKKAYQSDKENYPGYYLDSSAVLLRSDDRVFSFRQTEGSYFGGAHPNYFVGGENFDPKTGRKLSLEDVVTDYEKMYEYTKRYLGETMDLDELFPNYEETLDGYFHESGHSPLQWVLDAEGLKILFSPYDLGPYAMGSIEVEIPYNDAEGLIREEYLLTGKSLAKRIPREALQELDLDGDGTEDKLLLSARDSETNGEPDYYSVVTVAAGKIGEELDSMEYPLSGTFSEAWFMRTEDGRGYLYVVSSGDNDYSLMDVFDLNGKTPVHVGTVGDTPQGNLVANAENFTLFTRLDALGTYSGRKHYRVGADGMPETADGVYKIDQGGQWDRAITAARTVPVWMEKEGADGEKVRTELPAGTRFRIVGTDGETFVEAGLEDGRYCEIRYEMDDYRRSIEGVDEWEYFKDLPYAG